MLPGHANVPGEKGLSPGLGHVARRAELGLVAPVVESVRTGLGEVVLEIGVSSPDSLAIAGSIRNELVVTQIARRAALLLITEAEFRIVSPHEPWTGVNG